MGFDIVRAREHLTPYVGAALAEMCIRTTAISLGKQTEDLSFGDMPALGKEVSRILTGLATKDQIDRLVREMEGCIA